MASWSLCQREKKYMPCPHGPDDQTYKISTFVAKGSRLDTGGRSLEASPEMRRVLVSS